MGMGIKLIRMYLKMLKYSISTHKEVWTRLLETERKDDERFYNIPIQKETRLDSTTYAKSMEWSKIWWIQILCYLIFCAITITGLIISLKHS